MSKTYNEDIKEQLQSLFDKYCSETLSHLKKYFKYIIPVVNIQMITALCKLLESILDVQQVQGLEQIFVFACVWSIGAGFTEVDGKDFRKEFSNWWKSKWDTVEFPDNGEVYDYYVDIENSEFKEWSNLLGEEAKVNTHEPISNFMVPTTDTISFQYILKQYISVEHAPLLVGNAGCGKTQISRSLLKDLSSDPEAYTFQTINLNYFTDSVTLQNILEQRIEKRAGKTFAPAGNAKLIYFIDDLNLQELECYGTQNTIALLRQHADYGHWYNRNTMEPMEVVQTLKYACMNPSVGTGSVNPRLQRHFAMLAVPFPENSSLFTIYSTFLTHHFSEFDASVQAQVAPVVKATLALHGEVKMNFKKDATNFHYEFNGRHLTNLFQGLLASKPEAIKGADNFINLWVHEAERVYGDRLVSADHSKTFKNELGALVKNSFADFDLSKHFDENPENIVFARFAHGLQENLYDQFQTTEDLSSRLNEALREYNDQNRTMDLVLFEDALNHVCRISRIISSDRGHALLVGVGGSGKKSLSKLASFICKFNTMQIIASSNYGMNDLKADIQEMYNRAGVKDEGVLFLLTEGQITNEKFLKYINSLLCSGEIEDLYTAEEKDAIINDITPAAQEAGIGDSKEKCWEFFISRVNRNLHMSLCFSPVGESFRDTATKFPALINNTVIDWFQPWSQEALLSVSRNFTEGIDFGTDEVRNSVVDFMAYSFEVVREASEKFSESENRFVYITPKSFLGFINQFKTLLNKIKRGDRS